MFNGATRTTLSLLLTMSSNKSNKQQYFLHFIQFIVCVTFFLSFVTNPQSAPAQTGKVCEKEGGDEKGEREREGVLYYNVMLNAISFYLLHFCRILSMHLMLLSN